MASDAPTWLSDSNDAPPAAATTPAAAAAPATQAATSDNNTKAATVVSAQDERDLPQVILMMRLTNMALAAAVIAISIVRMISFPPISSFVVAVYATLGGLLICCLETQLKFLRVMIAVNFGFLFNSMWRFIFYLILASVCWSYEKVYGQIVAIAFVGVALFNTYVLCRYPAYRKMRERIAQEEDKRIEARISKEVRRQAVNQVMGGGTNNNNNATSMSTGV
mmetsp:Transcript_9040/g.24423  ORF Transcript_9040/g.24423 Transcript_9040/m.24423 type:complete len:222 (-) Transcript_9040:249-914(-)|eukprot:CAMPEP_0198134058 /NCGR_PEP_ID=MMETSP1442-20131203/59883_1 /TAXON_ID= /ORGANISM="Craspedostauros australis, Strain CCMP3328" /LENGTH=221 /DNA_ID=CAMNT_0043795195 /DNA_START=766 /DNA_END=1431 /DNA_ORIENTATION=+